jgi:hypothetical protein
MDTTGDRNCPGVESFLHLVFRAAFDTTDGGCWAAEHAPSLAAGTGRPANSKADLGRAHHGEQAPMLRRGLYRLLRATFMAILAWILFQVLHHYHREWLFVPIVGGLFAFWVGEQAWRLWLRKKKEADLDRWERAILVAAERPRAIAEVRRALDRSRRFGPRLRQEQAHLSVLLADLLDASGRAEEAVRVLARVDLDALKPSQAVVVRHAKVVAYLSAGLLDDAEAVLATRAHESGVPDMDARLDLLGGLLAIERGRPEDAMATADQVETRLPHDPAIRAEALVLRAVALDARGDRAGAMALLRALEPDTLEYLEVVGPRRVRPLAALARASTTRPPTATSADQTPNP